LNAHLVSIMDPFEQAYLQYYLKQNGKNTEYWIGYKSDAQSDANMTQIFQWTDGWPNYYTNWDRVEPIFTNVSQDACVAFNQGNGTWRTILCNTQLGYICKTTSKKMPNINGDTSGKCPKLQGNTDSSLSWVDVDKRSKYCYWFSSDRKSSSYQMTGVQTWNDAAFHCRRRNGTLASVHSKHDLLLIDTHFQKVKQINSYYNYWLGLSKQPNGMSYHIIIITLFNIIFANRTLRTFT